MKKYPKNMINSDGTKNYAYVVYTSELYISAALVLAESIKKLGSLSDLVVLISNEMYTENNTKLLKMFYDKIIPVESIIINNTPIMTKLHSLRLSEYKKIVLIDADSIVLKNPDYLFTIKSPSKISSSVKQQEYMKKYCNDDGLLTGVLILEPNISKYETIMAEVQNNKIINELSNYDKPLRKYLEKQYDKWHDINEKIISFSNYDDVLIYQYTCIKPFILKNKLSIEERLQHDDLKLWFTYYKNILNKYHELYENESLKDVNTLVKYFLSSLGMTNYNSHHNTKNMFDQVKKIYDIKSDKNLIYYHLNISKEYDSEQINYKITNTTDLSNISEYVRSNNNISIILSICDDITVVKDDNIVYKNILCFRGDVLKNILFMIYQKNVYNERIKLLKQYIDDDTYKLSICIYKTVYPLNLDSSKYIICSNKTDIINTSSVLFNDNTLKNFNEKNINFIINDNINKYSLAILMKFQTMKKWIYNIYNYNSMKNIIVQNLFNTSQIVIIDSNKYSVSDMRRLIDKKLELFDIIFTQSQLYKNEYNIDNQYIYELDGVKLC